MPSTSKENYKIPRKNITYQARDLPKEGYVRKPSFVNLLGISDSTFNNRVKEGKIPAGILLSPRCRVWNVATIRDYLASLENQEAA